MLKNLMTIIQRNKNRIALWLFGTLTFFMPMQKQWHKTLDRLGEKLCSTMYPFDKYFAGKMQFSNADIFIVLLMIFAITNFKGHFKTPLSKAINLSLAGYLSCCIASMVLSEHSNYPTAYFIFIRYALFWGLYWIIAEGLIERSFTKISTIFLSCTALSSTMQALISIGQYFKQYSLGLKRLGETSFAREGKIAVNFDMNPASVWIFAKTYSENGKQFLLRSYGTFAHPNILGWYLAVGIIATLYLFEKAKNRTRKAALFLAILIEVFALFTSYSRSALLGLIFSLGCYVMLHQGRKNALYVALVPTFCIGLSTIFLTPQLIARGHYTSIMPLLIVYIVSAFAGALLGWILKTLKHTPFLYVYNNIISFLKNKKRSTTIISLLTVLSSAIFIHSNKFNFINESILKLTDEHRLINPFIALKMMFSHPFVGTGFSMYSMHMKDFIPPFIKEEMCMTIHNIFMLIGAETGFIGLFFFLALIIIPLWIIRKTSIDRETTYMLTILFVTLFVGMCDMHYLIFVQGRLFFFSLLGLLALRAKNPSTILQPHIAKAL